MGRWVGKGGEAREKLKHKSKILILKIIIISVYMLTVIRSQQRPAMPYRHSATYSIYLMESVSFLPALNGLRIAGLL